MWWRNGKKEFGPNQDAVDALLVRLETVTQAQAMLLAGISGDDPERHRARQAVVEAARRCDRERELKRAQDEVRQWVNTWFTGGPQLSGYGRDVSPGEAAVAASPAVLDAIGALVVRDLLPAEDVELLMGPWKELLQSVPVPGA
jgi:hypothetical protein